MTTKNYVAFSGGAAKGGMHFGFCSTLDRKSIDGYSGTSIGALMAWLMCTPNFDPVRDYKYFMVNWPAKLTFPHIWKIAEKKHICESAALYEFAEAMARVVNIDPKETFKTYYLKTKKHLKICAFNFTHFKTDHLDYLTTPDYNVMEAVIASMSVPIYFDPVALGDSFYFDGGMMENNAQPWSEGTVLSVVVGSSHNNETKLLSPLTHSWADTKLQDIGSHVYARLQYLGSLTSSSSKAVVRTVKIPSPSNIEFKSTELKTVQWNHLFFNGMMAGIQLNLQA